ncbi:hypothetical protein [Robbsia sp. KACC 23696]|uniref:hypothetical protein n=1 Tax=Robbsia sp. KACC 23696 TaxID=3149231 RepID=UPI00325B1FB3
MSLFTPNAVRLASVYFPILVDCARRKRITTYDDLISAAKARHPKNEDVARAMPSSTGQKLEVIKAFCKKANAPDLASLAVNTDSASADEAVEKPVASAAQQQAFSYDWEQKLIAFDTYVIDALKGAVQPTKRKEPEASKVLFEYYAAHKRQLPPDIAKQKAKIIALLMDGYEAEDAFAQAADGR